MRACLSRVLTTRVGRINMGRGRDVPNPKPPAKFNVHRSVDIRMKATGFVQNCSGKMEKTQYAPKAKYKATPEWVAWRMGFKMSTLQRSV